MKSRILQSVILCTTLIAASHADARGPASKSFGGFSTGKLVTLTVREVTSTQAIGSSVKSKVPIPESIPKFAEGQKVTFSVGRKGELTGPKFSIPFLNFSGNVNSYAKQPTQNTASPITGSVFKDSKGKPVAATLTFYQYRITDYRLSVNLVGYVLN